MGLMPSLLVVGLDEMAGQIGMVSLHSGVPGTTGASEISGGSPIYTRKTPSIASAIVSGSSAVAALSVALSFDVYNCVVSHVGLWKADGTSWLGWEALPSPRTFTGVQDVLVLDTLTFSLP